MTRIVRSVNAYRQAWLAVSSLMGFAILYLAAPLFGNEGIEYLFAEVDRESLHTAGHIVIYGTLAVMLAKSMGNRYLLAWLIGNILAAGEEWHQRVVPGRVASIDDALMNLGSITAFLLLAHLFTLLPRIKTLRLSHPLPATLPKPTQPE